MSKPSIARIGFQLQGHQHHQCSLPRKYLKRNKFRPPIGYKICYNYLFLKTKRFSRPLRSKLTMSVDKYPSTFPYQLVFIYIFHRKEATEKEISSLLCFMFLVWYVMTVGKVLLWVSSVCWDTNIETSVWVKSWPRAWPFIWIQFTGDQPSKGEGKPTIQQQKTIERDGGKENFSWLAWNSERKGVLPRLHNL